MSADLRRISYWIYNGQSGLANDMLSKLNNMYKNIDPKVGCYKNIWHEIEKIGNSKDKDKSAEIALTLSVILQRN
jgi:hypothetical protein